MDSSEYFKLSCGYCLDRNLISNLLDTMEKTGADFTNTFRYLSRVTPTECSSVRKGFMVYLLHNPVYNMSYDMAR